MNVVINKRLKFQNFVEDVGNAIVFYSEQYCSLFRCHRYGGVAELLYTIPIKESTRLYGKVYRYKEKIICIPQCAENILIYELNSREVRFIDLGVYNWGNHYAEEGGKFLSGVIYEKYLFMIGYWSTCILKFDIEQEEIVNYINLSEDLNISIDKRRVCFKNVVLYRGNIILPAYGSNQLFIINPNTMNYQNLDISNNKGGFSDIAVASNDIWLAPKCQEAFLRLGDSMNVVEVIENFPSDYRRKERANISGLIEWKDSIYAMPYMANKILEITRGDECSNVRIEGEMNDYYTSLGTEKELMKFGFVQISNRELFVYCNETNEILVKRDKSKMEICRYLLSQKDGERWLLKKAGSTDIIIETEGDLQLLISGLKDYKVSDGQEIIDEAGHYIYDKICNS